jgi:hypothetical protein
MRWLIETLANLTFFSLHWILPSTAIVPVTILYAGHARRQHISWIWWLQDPLLKHIFSGKNILTCDDKRTGVTIAGQCRTNLWKAVLDWPWCWNADAGLKKLTAGKNADAGLTFLQHSGIYLWFFNIMQHLTPAAAVYWHAGYITFHYLQFAVWTCKVCFFINAGMSTIQHLIILPSLKGWARQKYLFHSPRVTGSTGRFWLKNLKTENNTVNQYSRG